MLPSRQRLAAAGFAAGMLLVGRPAAAGASVWVIDDGEKIRRDATETAFERGEHNPVWQPGGHARVFAMRGESVALQVVVEAGEAALDEVTVSLPELDGPGGAALGDSRAAAPGGPQRPIERFVEHFVEVRRPSGGRVAGESLGWSAGAGPPRGRWVGPVPDALVPVEASSSWCPYPMHVAAHTNGVVWIDLNVPRDARAGTYRGAIDVRERGRELAVVAVELSIADASLPDGPPATVYYDPDELARRVGPGAEAQLWRLLHAHRIAPLHDATSAEDVRRQREALDGSLYTPARGYVGAAVGEGDGVLSLGAYGALGAPSSAALARVAEIADEIAAADIDGRTEVFLYAADERCDSPWGAGWRALLRGARDERLRRVRVGWTCSNDPASQPVDIAMLLASYDRASADAARRRGKDVWVYNGVLPRTGTFLLDADAVSPRVNGWLAGMFGVARWFYWESTFWYGLHGADAVDPFVDPESLHNADGDWANGDGVLLYPGRQVDRFQEHSLGFEGVVPSIRLKNWRRGIEDAAYLELARRRDRARADAVASALIPAAFGEARPGRPPSWSPRGEAFFLARRELLDIALGPSVSPQPPAPRRPGPGAVLGVMAAAAAAAVYGLRRASRRAGRS